MSVTIFIIRSRVFREYSLWRVVVFRRLQRVTTGRWKTPACFSIRQKPYVHSYMMPIPTWCPFHTGVRTRIGLSSNFTLLFSVLIVRPCVIIMHLVPGARVYIVHACYVCPATLVNYRVSACVIFYYYYFFFKHYRPSKPFAANTSFFHSSLLFGKLKFPYYSGLKSIISLFAASNHRRFGRPRSLFLFMLFTNTVLTALSLAIFGACVIYLWGWRIQYNSDNSSTSCDGH